MPKKLLSPHASPVPIAVSPPVSKPPKLPPITGFNAQRRNDFKRVQTFVNRRRGK
jgi:hypothetical protein